MGYDDREVLSLVERYARERSPQLRDAIVVKMAPLVECVARKFAGTEPLEDLISEGFLGLLQAVEQFDPTRGTKFSTYATHLIGGHIRHHLRDRGHIIRQPAWLQELGQRMQHTIEVLEQELHRQPSAVEIAARMNLTEEAVEELLSRRQAAQVVRMDAGSAEDDDWLMVDTEKIRNRRPTTLALSIEDRIVLEETMVRLKDLERRVLYYFFYQDLNQSEIARLLGISCNYVGHLLHKGLGKLRNLLEPGGEGGVPAELFDRAAGGVIDVRTGLYTAAYFRERLIEEVSRAQRYDRPLALCYLMFPRHLEETCFREAAARMRASLRRSDVAARTGEREIAIILVETGAVATRVAERLARVAQQAGGAPVSTGSVTFPEHGRSSQELYDAVRAAAAPPSPALAPAVVPSV